MKSVDKLVGIRECEVGGKFKLFTLIGVVPVLFKGGGMLLKSSSNPAI